MAKLFWPATYIATIVAVNYGFSAFPGQEWLWSMLIGSVFVTRDFAQRAVGHWCLLAMAIAAALSWWLADPFVALASVCAFAASELIDWLIYTVSKRPIADRVLLSSAISTPVDSVVFLAMIGALSLDLVALQVAAKMVAALVVWALLRRVKWFAVA
jgi:queuosine precursor transporter